MSYRKLQRTSSQRRALLRDLTTSLIVNGKIETTEARAKEVRSTADKMISLAKKGDLSARRKAAAFMRDVVADVKEDGDNVAVQTALQKLFSDLGPQYADRMVVTHEFTRLCLVVATVHKWLSWNSLTS